MEPTHRDPFGASATRGASSPQSLVELFEGRTRQAPEALAYVFVGDDLATREELTYRELGRQVRSLAARLARQAGAGDRALLIYGPGLDVVRAFWACLLAGLVPVPAPSPAPAQLKTALPRLRTIAEDAQVSSVLTTLAIRDAARDLSLGPEALPGRWIVTDGRDDEADNFRATAPAPGDLAYLQYTSGSTAVPRGVMITHANVLANCTGMTRDLQVDQQARGLSWLPHFHDYGLVQGIICPLFLGIPSYLMSPLTFLRRPLRWLEAVSRFKITHSGGPSFAYAACAQALAQEQQWNGNLRSLRLMSCGAEPINPVTVERFITAFAPHGFSAMAFTPGYGLAEATLGVTQKPHGTAPALLTVHTGALENGRIEPVISSGGNTRTLVGCGAPILDTHIAIVDPASGARCSVDRVGEVWLSSPSIGGGYWRNPEATRTTFEQRLSDSSRGYLRTGDLGFLRNGELYITGRLKDLLIIHGRNYYPQDIEWTVERAASCLRAGYGAAFSIESEDGEQLVVMQELTRGAQDADLDSAVTEIRKAVAQEHGLPIYAVVLIQAGSIARTSSGKIRRQSCRQDFLEERLSVIRMDALSVPDDSSGNGDNVAPRGPIEQALWEIWSEVLRKHAIGVHQNFFELGGHSLLATQVISRVRQTLQVDLPVRALFEAPSIAELAQCVARQRTEHGSSQEPPVEAVPRGQPLPVSFSQRRMWFIQQLEPRGTAYNMPFALRLKGHLDHDALARAVEIIVSRHEAFRTTFAVADGEPVQCIASQASAGIREIDLRHLPEPDRVGEAARLFREEAMRPFDLARGPLFRFVLIQLDEADHVVLWLIHHAVGDQWSAGIISRELATLYRALTRGESPVLAPLAIQYADFAAWQRRHLGGEALDAQLAYWREKLKDLTALALPSDRPRPPRQTYRGSHVTATIPPDTLSALKRMSARQGATAFMTLLACFKLLLARYCGQDDIAVGTPIANRTRVATEALIGTLVNTLVMRTYAGGEPTFSEYLARVRDTALEAYAHQDLPFERLVEALGGARDTSHSPLVQVLFNVANAPLDDLGLDGLEFEIFDFDHGSAQFDLSVTVDTEMFGQVYLSYASDLFDAATAQRVLTHYLRLIEQAVADPEQAISAYDLIIDEERASIVGDWNRTARAFPADKRTDELFALQARRTPHAVAVSMDTRTLTYAELDTRANRLAHYLRRQGIGSEALVGICLERSPEMVVALLAAMKAGGAYVPLDPAFPRDRLELMARDAGLSVVLSESIVSASLPELPVKTIALDKCFEAISQESDNAVESTGSTADLAYVLYTSGSTGKPKGVEITHRALTNFLWSMREAPGCGEHDTLLAVTTLSFDIAALELYLPLIVGARVELASRQEASDARLLMERIEQTQPTIMQATPATWRMLIEAGWSGGERLTVLCGGEGLPRELADRLLERSKALWNLYGPTETTIWSTVEQVERGTGEISIGRPIANTEVYILDKTLQPVPVGVPGELFIGGRGLARGYRNRPELTADRFVANPFTAVPGARMYRSGDLARYRPDGRIVHLGRLDFQVKIRGFRIELGEIESLLARHPALARAVVVAKDDGASMQQLVAYAIPREGERPSVAELRAFVRASLPDYMVPAHVVFLDALPLTANNKIDVKALPEPVEDRGVTAERQPEPRGQIEVQLLALWRQVLGDATLGVHDNFFDRGGHSLSAVQLLALIEQVYGRQLPLATLFQAPSVAQMSALLTESSWQVSWRSLVAIQPGGTAIPFFAVPGIGGNVLVFARLSKLLGANQPFYGLQARGLDGSQTPFASVFEMAAHYVREIRTLRPAGPYLVGGTCTGGVIAFEMAQQLIAQGEEVTLVIMETWHPRSCSNKWRPAMRPGALLYLWAKLLAYGGGLAAMPVREWPGFLRSKTRLVAALLDDGVEQTLAATTFYEERVARATWEAVARYKAQAYPGALLNIIAANRHVDAHNRDTRRAWESLARDGSRFVSIPAENSGRLFVSPHVDALARHIAAYTAGPLLRSDKACSDTASQAAPLGGSPIAESP